MWEHNGMSWTRGDEDIRELFHVLDVHRRNALGADEILAFAIMTGFDLHGSIPWAEAWDGMCDRVGMEATDAFTVEGLRQYLCWEPIGAEPEYDIYNIREIIDRLISHYEHGLTLTDISRVEKVKRNQRRITEPPPRNPPTLHRHQQEQQRRAQQSSPSQGDVRQQLALPAPPPSPAPQASTQSTVTKGTPHKAKPKD